ncbi:hypothetical protein GKJPGBOP_00948 [Streptomyces paromomycinus]|uniref:Uncharacterized protein n=1 Tax=Streptomyces paromomycinus TaxID=92743 RepID=A0A401VW57_STREY|nr:hypothetical protein GKJPGBOP_00948 [Streptomyces paromomycinus]
MWRRVAQNLVWAVPPALVFVWLTVWWDGRPWSDMLVRGLSAWFGWTVVLTVSDWRRERRSAKRTPQKTD